MLQNKAAKLVLDKTLYSSATDALKAGVNVKAVLHTYIHTTLFVLAGRFEVA